MSSIVLANYVNSIKSDVTMHFGYTLFCRGVRLLVLLTSENDQLSVL